MSNLNSILLEGNLVRNPEVKYSKDNVCICEFSIASNHYYKKNNEERKDASFFDVTVFGQTAKDCSEQLKKGHSVRIVGRLKQSRWQDGQGKNRSKIFIVADHVESNVWNKQIESKQQAAVLHSRKTAGMEMGD